MEHWNRWHAESTYPVRWPLVPWPPRSQGDPHNGTVKAAKYWFPPGTEWSDIEYLTSKGITTSTASDLKYLPLYIAVLYVWRTIFLTFIGRPLGMYLLGVVSKRTAPERCQALEVEYKKNKNPKEFLVIPTGWTVFRVKRWYRRRRNSDRPDRLKKFEETAYTFWFHFTMYLVGQYCIAGEDYIADPYLCWQSIAYQHMKDYIMYYYFTQCSFYAGCLLSLFSDVRRKDFYEQIAHHVVTCTLLIGSYMFNFWRVGTLLLVINDLSDWLIQLSKLLVYTRCKQAADVVVGLFAISWIYTRNYVYITVVLHATIMVPFELGHTGYISLYVFNGFLIILGGLQIFWTFILLRFAKKLILNPDQKVEDDRSDPEEYTDDEDDDVSK